jgi:hypothetical protein
MKSKKLYIVLSVHTEAELSGIVGGVLAIPTKVKLSDMGQGSIGVCCVFAKKKDAKKFADGRYEILECATKRNDNGD